MRALKFIVRLWWVELGVREIRLQNSIWSRLFIKTIFEGLDNWNFKNLDRISIGTFLIKNFNFWLKIHLFEEEYDGINYFCINVYVELIAYFQVLV